VTTKKSTSHLLGVTEDLVFHWQNNVGRQSYATIFPVGSTIVAVRKFVYGQDKPIDRIEESHEAGSRGQIGDMCLVLGYFHITNGMKEENGLEVWNLRLHRKIWIYKPLFTCFSLF
jgi:hypothetical protein